MSEHKYENHMLITRFRNARGTLPSAAFWVQTERDVVMMLETLDHLREENERLRKIVDLIDLKNENDALRLKIKELTGE